MYYVLSVYEYGGTAAVMTEEGAPGGNCQTIVIFVNSKNYPSAHDSIDREK